MTFFDVADVFFVECVEGPFTSAKVLLFAVPTRDAVPRLNDQKGSKATSHFAQQHVTNRSHEFATVDFVVLLSILEDFQISHDSVVVPQTIGSRTVSHC